LHTIRTAIGSFFFMANKPAYTVADQIALLKQRGMLFNNEADGPHFLLNISYYPLKGYWWDMQDDYVTHNFDSSSFNELWRIMVFRSWIV
jgi:abortive infection bacteriophage resistance protein